MMAPTPSDEAAPGGRIPQRRGRTRRRWVTGWLLSGLLLSGWWLFGSAPREHTVQLQVDRPRSLRRLEIVWLDGDQLLKRTVLRFDHASAPALIQTTLRATNGRYRLQLMTQRATASASAEHRVIFDGEASSARLHVP